MITPFAEIAFSSVYQEINPEYGTLCNTENFVEYANKIEIKLEPVIKEDINADFQENLLNDVNDLKVNKNDIKIEQNNIIEKNDIEEKM